MPLPLSKLLLAAPPLVLALLPLVLALLPVVELVLFAVAASMPPSRGP
jgi:hypothetical protein